MPSQPRGSPLSLSCPRCAWAAREAHRRGLDVEGVPVLPLVRRRHRRLQVGGQRRPGVAERRVVGCDLHARRARRVEQAGVRRGDAAEREPRRAVLERLQLQVRLVGARRSRAAPAVDEHEAREIVRARLPVEVPGCVGGRDRAAERVAAEHDLAALLLGCLDDTPHVLDLDVHAPVACVGDVGVRDELEVLRDARVGDEAQVVVEQLLGGGLALLGLVEHRVVLEEVLPALDRPDLPALRCADDVLRQRLEVGGAGGGAGHEDEDVLGVARAGLEDADLVVLGGRSRRVEALELLELDVDLLPRRPRLPTARTSRRRAPPPRRSIRAFGPLRSWRGCGSLLPVSRCAGPDRRSRRSLGRRRGRRERRGGRRSPSAGAPKAAARRAHPATG